MRPAVIAAFSLAFLLLAGCSLPSQPSGIKNFPPKDFSEPVSAAKSILQKSKLPAASKNMTGQIPLPPSGQAPAANGTGENASQGRQADAPPPAALPAEPSSPTASNSTATQVTAPSNESAPEIQAEISISNPHRPQVYFYYSTSCPFSMAILPFVQYEQARFDNFTEWHSFNVFTQQGYYFFDRMAIEQNLTSAGRVVPIIIVDGQRHSMLVGIDAINSTLVPLLWNETKKERLAAN